MLAGLSWAFSGLYPSVWLSLAPAFFFPSQLPRKVISMHCWEKRVRRKRREITQPRAIFMSRHWLSCLETWKF